MNFILSLNIHIHTYANIHVNITKNIHTNTKKMQIYTNIIYNIDVYIYIYTHIEATVNIKTNSNIHMETNKIHYFWENAYLMCLDGPRNTLFAFGQEIWDDAVQLSHCVDLF